MIAPLVCCSQCEHYRATRCKDDIDLLAGSSPPWQRIAPDVGHYCLAYTRKAPSCLVRCADCRHVSYRTGPPEDLSCAHGLVVTISSVCKAERQCALFEARENLAALEQMVAGVAGRMAVK